MHISRNNLGNGEDNTKKAAARYYTSGRRDRKRGATVKIRPRKACRYPNLRSFGWVSYDKVGVLYSGELGSRSEARASDLRSYPGL